MGKKAEKQTETVATDALSAASNQARLVVDSVERLLGERVELRCDAETARRDAKKARDELITSTLDARLGNQPAKTRAAKLRSEAAVLEQDATVLDRAAAELDDRIATEYIHVANATSEFEKAITVFLDREVAAVVKEAEEALAVLAPSFARIQAMYGPLTEPLRAQVALGLPGWWGALDPATEESEAAIAGDAEAERLRSTAKPALDLLQRLRKTGAGVRKQHDERQARDTRQRWEARNR